LFNIDSREEESTMEEMDCDQLASLYSHLITRMGRGDERTILIWKIN